MKSLFLSALILISSFSASALTITENKMQRPLTLSFLGEEISYKLKTYYFKHEDSEKFAIAATIMSDSVILYYYNSTGKFIFKESISGTQLDRVFDKATLDESCPITFKILPEQKKFDNIHLGCDSYASVAEDKTFI